MTFLYVYCMPCMQSTFVMSLQVHMHTCKFKHLPADDGGHAEALQLTKILLFHTLLND